MNTLIFFFPNDQAKSITTGTRINFPTGVAVAIFAWEEKGIPPNWPPPYRIAPSLYTTINLLSKHQDLTEGLEAIRRQYGPEAVTAEHPSG